MTTRYDTQALLDRQDVLAKREIASQFSSLVCQMKMRLFIRFVGFVVIFYLLPAGCMFAQHSISDGNDSWWQLRRDSSEQAPPATETSDAIVQVYAARAARWRGAFGVHTWYATKRTDETRYTRLEVIGYSVYWGHDAVRIRGGSPDAYWFGNRPTLLREIRGGEDVDAIIDRLHARARAYPYNDTYHVWPGPNSNTFTAYVARSIPELQLELPSTAIGKDYVPLRRGISKTPSGTGGQLSIKGYAGVLLGVEEGLELNLFGLTAGIDLYPPALKLPAIGRLGFSDFKSLPAK